MSTILKEENIRVGVESVTKTEAIDQAGQVLVDQGYVKPEYIGKMHEREQLTSTYMGNLLAIPHGTEEGKSEVLHSGISITLYKEPIDWDGQEVQVVIGIAGKGDEHLDILSQVAITFSEEENVERIIEARTASDVLKSFDF